MQVNEGKTDRVIRIVVGLLLLSLVFIGPKTLLGLVGIIPLVTGLAGRCLLYSVLAYRLVHTKRRKVRRS